MHLLVAMILAQALDPELLSELAYRYIGPDGNRTIAIAGEPGNNAVVYIVPRPVAYGRRPMVARAGRLSSMTSTSLRSARSP